MTAQGRMFLERISVETTLPDEADVGLRCVECGSVIWDAAPCSTLDRLVALAADHDLRAHHSRVEG